MIHSAASWVSQLTWIIRDTYSLLEGIYFCCHSVLYVCFFKCMSLKHPCWGGVRGGQIGAVKSQNGARRATPLLLTSAFDKGSSNCAPDVLCSNRLLQLTTMEIKSEAKLH